MNFDRIATLLASGLPPASVASIVGLSAGRISQIMKEPAFEILLAGKQAEIAAKDIEEISLSARYLEIEHKLVNQIGEMTVGAEMRDLVGALRVVAERQDRMRASKNPAPVAGNIINTYVQVSLPTHIMEGLGNVQLSSQKEIIAIGERTLSPLPSEQVIGLFGKMGAASDSITIQGDSHVTSPALDSSEGSIAEDLSLPTGQAEIESKAAGPAYDFSRLSMEVNDEQNKKELLSGASSFLSRLQNRAKANSVPSSSMNPAPVSA